MALEAQNNPFTSVLFVGAADPEAIGDADPSSGSFRLVCGDDGLFYSLDDAGVATLIGGGSGAVGTDVIWNAKGDLAVGTGSDTAIRRAVGSNGQVLTADSAETDGVKWATPSAGSITYTSAQLGSPVTLNTSTFTDVLSLSLATGTWLVMAQVTAETTAASVTGIEIKMWDGTNLFGSSDTVLAAGPGYRSPLVIIPPPIVLGTTTTVKISGKTIVAAGQISSSTTTATTAKASNLVAVKLV